MNKLTRAMEEGRDARSKQAAKAWQSEDEEEEGGWPAELCGVDVVHLAAALLWSDGDAACARQCACWCHRLAVERW